MRPLLLLLILSGCVIHAAPNEMPGSPAPVPQSCPELAPIAPAPKPVWPDSCVADWYAKASLPPCVESYLKQLKTQQKTIAKKHAAKADR